MTSPRTVDVADQDHAPAQEPHGPSFNRAMAPLWGALALGPFIILAGIAVGWPVRALGVVVMFVAALRIIVVADKFEDDPVTGVPRRVRS